MAYGVKLLVWGKYASFNRPEMKVERVSYDVITPGAARGILEAIYWKPEMRVEGQVYSPVGARFIPHFFLCSIIELILQICPCLRFYHRLSSFPG